MILHFYTRQFPLPKDAFVPSLNDIGPVVVEKEFTGRRTDRSMGGEPVIRKTHLSFQIRLAKKNKHQHQSLTEHTNIQGIQQPTCRFKKLYKTKG